MKNDSFIEYWRNHWWWTYGKVSYNCFYDRVKHGWSWKEATQKENRKYSTAYKGPVPTVRKKEEKSVIDIKYKTEESLIFKRAYEEKINDLENKIEQTENPTESKIFVEQLEEVKREYQIFLHHNQ